MSTSAHLLNPAVSTSCRQYNMALLTLSTEHVLHHSASENGIHAVMQLTQCSGLAAAVSAAGCWLLIHHTCTCVCLLVMCRDKFGGPCATFQVSFAHKRHEDPCSESIGRLDATYAAIGAEVLGCGCQSKSCCAVPWFELDAGAEGRGV